MSAIVPGWRVTKISAGLTALSVVLSSVVGLALTAAAAQADTAQTGTLPATVSADSLPTVQINGVVWSQATVGNTVYAGGSFSTARPSGVAAGGTGQVTRNNLLAYDITTGNLVSSFNHSFNAQVLSVVASPNGSTVYVGGDFTTVDGATHNHLVAINTANGTLVTGFTPNLNGSVRSLAASNTAVFVGGSFSTASGSTRTRLAEYTSSGSLAAWAPSASDAVGAMVLTPDQSSVIVGGHFITLNTTSALGLGSLNATTGATQAFAANQIIQDSGSGSDITSLATDGTNIYGAGYYFSRGGNFEGRFAANPSTGAIVWMNSCHGDTYNVFPIGSVLYSAGHEHDCSDIGSFTQDNPAVFTATHHYTAAETTYQTGTLRAPLIGGMYFSFDGRPDSTQLDWYPTFTQGTYTGQSQAAWSVSGNSNYLSVGGEFPTVNGTSQQGLARFAVSAVATNKSGPVSQTTLKPVALSQSSGTARVGFQATWDRDNTALTYKLYRDSGTTPIYTTSYNSTFYDRPDLGFLDTGLTAGSSHTYKVVVTDPFGNSLTSATSSAVTIATTTATGYNATVRSDSPIDFWPLSETSGSTANDNAGYTDLTRGSATTAGAAGPIAGSQATRFAGGETTVMNPMAPPTVTTNSLINAYANQTVSNTSFSLEAWVNTTTTAGGAILNDGMYSTGDSNSMDRVIYMDTSGKLYFGVQNDTAYQAISSIGSYNNGAWHHIVATLNGTTATLYVDGLPVASGSMTDNSIFKGYWRIGGDALAGAAFGPPGTPPTVLWPNGPSNGYIAASIADAAVYPTVLSAARVTAHYLAAGGLVGNQPPTASYTYIPTNLSVAFDASASSDPDGTISSYAWTFGDGSTGTGVNPSHTYASAGSYPVGLTVTDNLGATGSTTRSVTVSAANQAPTASFTAAPTNLSVAFDASASSDPDGTISSYAWTFGDGSTGTGVNPSHTYASAGSYPVGLTVTDNLGATGSTSQSVAVTSGTAQVVTDTFTRTVANGLGSADVGGAWTTTGSTSLYAVNGSSAQLTISKVASGPSAFLNSASALNVTATVDVTLGSVPTGGGTYIALAARRIGTSDYRVKARFQPTSTSLQLTKLVNGAETVLSAATITGFVYNAGDTVHLELTASGSGSTSLAGKVWKAGTTEPTAAQVSTADSEPTLQSAGGVGIWTYLASTATTVPVVASFDNLGVTSP